MCKKNIEPTVEKKLPRENLINQWKYNSKRSKRYKKLYYWFEIPSIILGAMIPVIVMIKDIPSIIPAIISGIVGCLKTISFFGCFKNYWISSRNIAEQLKSELRQYDAKINEYDVEDEKLRNKALAKKLEAIIRDGNKDWITLIEKNEEDKK